MTDTGTVDTVMPDTGTKAPPAREQLHVEDYLHEQCVEYLLKNARDVVVVVNEQGCLDYASPSFGHVFGYSSHDLLGAHMVGPIHPRDRRQAQQVLQRALELGRWEVSEFRYRCADGRYRWVEIVGEALDGNGYGSLRLVLTLRDVTERKRGEEEIQWLMRSNRRTMGGSIQALNRIVAHRDPYTASHQERVATMSVAIAQKLGLDAHQVLGLKFAAGVHDLGKIAVPSELLTKPGPLTNLEFEIIQTHVETGYAILREMEFPWPLADIVYQHHERMDGSGYHGMEGSSLLVESRILGVADVVEAMSSHRPYRPALGIEEALAEVRAKSGCHFDATVAAACVELAENGELPYGSLSRRGERGAYGIGEKGSEGVPERVREEV